MAIIALPACSIAEDLVVVKPRIKLAESTTPDGGAMTLYEHDGAFSISFSGQELMHSKASASETLLGQLSVERIEKGKPARILIGGLGLGFTLRSVLEGCSAEASVELVELSERGNLAARLGALQQPTVYICGSPRGTGSFSKDLLASAGVQLQTVQESGHWPFIDQQEAFAEQMGLFLNQGHKETGFGDQRR